MAKKRIKVSLDDWFGEAILPGESKNVELSIGESYSSMTVRIPIHIRRAKKEGPVVFVTAALHGDEINGTGAIRELIQDENLVLSRGSIILIPVLNLLAFDRHSRYLPDRRDLNRSFPGSTTGSLASRMARVIFKEIVSRADFGIDLHTASVRRTNYPNIRGDLTNPAVRRMAEAFGSEIIINAKGPRGSFRREACKAGCPTIIMEGGEVWKVEPGVVETAVRGVKNVLRDLDMIEWEPEKPNYQIVIEKSKWIRAERGGFLQFHISPGDIVEKGQSLSMNTTLLGDEQNELEAPFDAVVIGMTSLPAISPGDAFCHLGKLPGRYNPAELRRLRSVETDDLERRVSQELGSSVLIFDRDENGDT